MTTSHIDVSPFRAAIDVAVCAPRELPKFLSHRFDDPTLEAIRAVCDYMARACSAVQGHRKFEQMWQQASLPAVGIVEAGELAEMLANLSVATPGGVGDTPAPVPDGVRAATPPVLVPAQKIHPRTGAASSSVDEPAANHVPWPASPESEST